MAAVGGTGRPAGRTEIKIIKNKEINICWLTVSGCMLDKVGA